MDRRVAVIGDVHATPAALIAMLELVPRDAALVFVGDYVNRGPDARGVLARLVRLESEREDVHFLRGNHDDALLQCIEEGAVVPFLAMGGASTIRSYATTTGPDVVETLRSSIPNEHLGFLRNLTPCFRADGLVVAHDVEQATACAAEASGAFLVYGHDVQKDLVPTITNGQAAIDTGCGTLPGGRLCCFLWPDFRWALVDERGGVVANL